MASRSNLERLRNADAVGKGDDLLDSRETPVISALHLDGGARHDGVRAAILITVEHGTGKIRIGGLALAEGREAAVAAVAVNEAEIRAGR